MLKKRNLTIWFNLIACLLVFVGNATGTVLCIERNSHLMLAPCTDADCAKPPAGEKTRSEHVRSPASELTLQTSSNCCTCTDVSIRAGAAPSASPYFPLLESLPSDYDVPSDGGYGFASGQEGGIQLACELPTARSPVLASLSSVILLI